MVDRYTDRPAVSRRDPDDCPRRTGAPRRESLDPGAALAIAMMR